MRSVESSLIKPFASAQMDFKEILKTSVSKLVVEPILIAHSMRNVTAVVNHFLKLENVKDFAYEIHALLVQPALPEAIEKSVLVIHH